MPRYLRGRASFLGHGIVGGSLLSIDEMSRDTADVAVRLLHGAAPTSIDVPVRLPGQPTFDWRELQRWGIPESRLPPGSLVRYRAPSLWSAYRSTVLSAIGVLAIQSLLIIGLLYQRRARRRAELESRNNLALAADASRRLTMSALTSSIAHELGQPLSSMIHNAQAGRMMLTAERATPDTMGEILSDIETEGVQATQIIDRHRTMLRGHQLDTKPIDLHVVIHESLALVAHDMRTRQIEATVNLSSSPCIITGDQVLLQQVMVNLLMNAMDAMAETPPARRRVTISTEVRAADVDVSVRDAGTGLPAQIDGALFTPFVTTKAHGLGIGLTITRTIVDAHGGTIDARNNPEGGATFTVTLRRSGTARTIRSGRRQTCCVGDVAQATPRADSRRPPWSGESHLPAAGTGLRRRGKRRRRQRRAGSRATTPTGRDCGRPQPASRPRTGGMSSDQARQPGRESHRVLGDERSGHQATILRGRSIGLCVQRDGRPALDHQTPV